jgi:hyperosmotically inducible protein
MRHSRFFAAVFAFASVGFLAAPACVASQATNQKEWQARSAARDAKTEVADSWLTARTKIALYADERVKGSQVSVETVNGTVRLYGKVDSQEARTAAASIAGGIEHVKAVKNDLQVVAPRDRKMTDISDQEITRLVESRFAKTDQLTEVAVLRMTAWSCSPASRPASGPAPALPSWPATCPGSVRSRTN